MTLTKEELQKEIHQYISENLKMEFSKKSNYYETCGYLEIALVLNGEYISLVEVSIGK